MTVVVYHPATQVVVSGQAPVVVQYDRGPHLIITNKTSRLTVLFAASAPGPAGPPHSPFAHLVGPDFTYGTGDRLELLTYDDGSTKALGYDGDDNLITVTTTLSTGEVQTKTLVYSGGVVIRVDEVIT